MSDDIRVYWDEAVDVYTIIINGVWLLQCGDDDDEEQAVGRCEIIEAEDVLVYDSAKDEYSLIDENLVIPDVNKGASVDIFSLGWMRHDLDIWIDGWSRHEEYHEERTA